MKITISIIFGKEMGVTICYQTDNTGILNNNFVFYNNTLHEGVTT
ncbi:MAG: hypothetical protein ABI237_13900 [Ginsengibacter sp.]